MLKFFANLMSKKPETKGTPEEEQLKKELAEAGDPFEEKESTESKFVSCYNCTGKRMHSMCGMPMSGCVLCEKYGKGWGKLLRKYSTEKITITHDRNQTGKPRTETFTPPAFKCLWCEDSKKTKQQIWDDSKADKGCSDGGAHNMPRVEVACHKCCPEAYEKEYSEAKKRYFSGRETLSKN
jgi:hypothetical protein